MVPPLRDRDGDLDLLVPHLANQLSLRHGIPPRQFGPDVLAAFRAMPWPGNVRELRNVIEGLLLTGEGRAVSLHELEAVPSRPASAPAAPASTTLHDAEQDLIARAMREARGNVARASRMLKISRSTLYRKLAGHGVMGQAAPPFSGMQ